MTIVPLTLMITRGVTGVYVGQIKEVPGIIVQAKSEAQLKKEVQKSFDLYFEAFPELRKRFEEEGKAP